LVFARCIKEMSRLWPEQAWTCNMSRHSITHITTPVSCSHSSSFHCNHTSTHNPHTHDFRWVPDGLQSDVNTNQVMVNIDTSVLITNSNLNDFHIKINSDFNTVSEWFMVNSLSLNLTKIFYGIKIVRMQKYIIYIIMGCKRRESCRHLFRKLKILPLLSQYILSLFLFVINNRNQFKINSEINSTNSRLFRNFPQPRSNLSKYQKGFQHPHTEL
jgi:hypothetical protein